MASALKLQDNPLQYASGYSLDLYCASPEKHEYLKESADFYGETFSACRKEAKKYGWRLNRETRFAVCGKCYRKGYRP